MKALEYQVPTKEALENHVSIETFKKEGIGGDKKNIRAERLIEHLNRLQTRFAVEESDSSIEIFVEERALDS